MLIFTCFINIIFGIGMILSIQNVGKSIFFDVCYVSAGLVDGVNLIVAGVIIYRNLELESRGTVISLVITLSKLTYGLLDILNG